MEIKAVISQFSERLKTDKVELYIDGNFIAMAIGEKITVQQYPPKPYSKPYMIGIGDDIIPHTFYHVDLVEDLRKVKAG